ncbi:transketolase [bacterium]|nr:transketolase [bacterium]
MSQIPNDSTFIDWAKKTPKTRQNIIEMIHQCASGHPGGSLSLVEILTVLLEKGGIMKHNPSKPEGNDRDRLVLSKGHGCPALYAVYSAVGYDITESELMTLRHLDSRLQGHPDRVRIPYMEASTGSLGQGASIAQGIALAYKMEKNPHRVYCILGDGEMQEGQIWEVALSAAHHNVSNLTLILDYNKGQIDGPTNEIMNLEPLKQKWESFGWNTHLVDGHNYKELYQTLSATSDSRPSIVLANTIKGKGVSFMEGNISWHGKATNEQERDQALKEIKENISIGL